MKNDLSIFKRSRPLRVDPLSSFPVVQGRSWHRSGPPLVAEASSGRSLSLFWMKKESRLNFRGIVARTLSPFP